MATPIVVGLTAVIVAVTNEVPKVLVVRRMSHTLATPAQRGHETAGANTDDSLPSGPFDPARHRTLQSGLRDWVAEQTGLELRYVEQLYTFGDRYRDPREAYGGPRVLTVAYLALTPQSPVAGTGDARWHEWYDLFPWEDWRRGRPDLIDQVIRPALEAFIDDASDPLDRRAREERVGTSFGTGAARWDPVRTLDRYEILYEAGLVLEAVRDSEERAHTGLWGGTAGRAVAVECAGAGVDLGDSMVRDDRRILATALGRLRGKLAYRPVVFDLLPREFTLFQLQRTVEALAGQGLHKQNFRRTLAASELVEPTGRVECTGRGRPAELYRYRRGVLRAKTEGVSLPPVRAES